MKTGSDKLFELLTRVNVSPRTKIYQGFQMAFSGEDATKITVDGYAQVLMTPSAGVEAVIGCVAPDAMAEGKKITRALTTGEPMVGTDNIISGTLAQTTPTDIANMVGAISLSQVRVIGARNTAVLAAPAGRALWLNFDLQIKFDNKSDSGMKFSVTKPGQTVGSLTSFIVLTS